MRTTFIALLVLLASVAYGYYQQNPDDRAKLVAQANAFLQSVTGAVSSSSQFGTAPPVPGQGDTSASADSQTPVPIWTPPAVIPAQPNWSWTTTDGKSYQNVVITNVDPRTVTITHAMGVAHLPISTIPAAIQKQLNYDPGTAAALAVAAQAENKRQEEHPYYTMASLNEAQAAARLTHRPLAWVDSNLSYLSIPDPTPGSEQELTQMAMSYLKTRAIIIFLDGNTDLGTLSPVIRDQQLFQYDDVNVPPPHHFFAPKIAFSDPEITKPLGRVSYTQMKASGEEAISNVLQSISDK